MNQFLSVVDERDTDILGAGGFERYGNYGLLRSVVVVPAWRGRGLARRLTEHTVQYARELGIGSLYLLTMDADGFFAALGFRRVSRDEAPEEIQACRQYREQCPDSAVLMRKAL